MHTRRAGAQASAVARTGARRSPVNAQPSPRATIRIDGAFVLIILALAVFPARSPAQDPPEWSASRDASIVRTNDQFIIRSVGGDPYIHAPVNATGTPPFTVELRMRSDSEGPGEIFISTPQRPGFPRELRVPFLVEHDTLWHDYRIGIPTKEHISALRLDPSTAPGEIRIERLALLDSHGAILLRGKYSPGPPPAVPLGHSRIRAPAGKSEIVITTAARLAGAIHSLTWNGREFIDSTDHGRQLQSASSFDNTRDFGAETFNPTEAGSRRDGAGWHSTSRLLELRSSSNELFTRARMAFWLAPGERSEGQLARNSTTLARHFLSKRVRIGCGKFSQMLDYEVTFTTPPGEPHRTAQFEALTGYMPAAFERFWQFDPATRRLAPLSDGPGEIPHPVVLATADGSHAMGIFAPPQPREGQSPPGYGRWRFTAEKVVKWNCVFRLRARESLAPGDYAYRLLVPIGTLTDVERMLAEISVNPP
jgi:hypothetical protein